MKFTVDITPYRISFKSNYWLQLFCLVFMLIWLNSFLGTTDKANWFLENTLVFIFITVVVFTYRNYQFSDLSYLLICIYFCMHVYGAKYTYSENPFGYWLKEHLHTARNHYDRIVHFSFGFLLAYPLRELFLKWLKFPLWTSWILPIQITMSVGALYELIEWTVADVFFKAQGDAYLGSQGDMWDAQKDIFLAFSGSVLATTIISLIKFFFNIHEPQAMPQQ